MQLNNTTGIVDRNNRPTVLQKVALRAFFINDGVYYDPYEISGVTVFHQLSNQSPASVLDNNVIATSVADTPADIVMNFGASSLTGDVPPGAIGALDPSCYNPGNDLSSLSGVYRVKQGDYVCVLDGGQDQWGQYNFYGAAIDVMNSASSVGNYIDCWTLKFAEGSNWQTLVNDFTLYDDTFFTVTEPLMVAATNRLVNKHMTLSSIENLKITTAITIENKDIDESVKNIFRQSAITHAAVNIQKINEDSVVLPSHVEVSGYTDTSSSVAITSDNTILFKFDTTKLASHPNIADFGGLVGTYRISAKYTLLNETILTVPYYFTVS